MSLKPTESPLDFYKDNIQAWLGEGYSRGEIVSKLNELDIPTSKRSLYRALKRWNKHELTDTHYRRLNSAPHHRGNGSAPVEPVASACITSDTVEFSTKPSDLGSKPSTDNLGDLDRLIEDRGLDPSEWSVQNCTVNEWEAQSEGGISVPMRSLKVMVKRRPEQEIMPARVPGYIHKPRQRKQQNEKPKLVVCASDQHAPFHDERLHRHFCDWLAENKPDEGVLLGDTMDLPDLSRFLANPEWDCSTQDCINSGYSLLLDYVLASEDTSWTKLLGNHDERLRRKLLERAQELYGIRRADIPGKEIERSLYDPAFVLRLDELGIDYVNPNGNYEFATHKLSQHLAAKHGWKVRQKSGTSAHATLEALGVSVLVGHTHRQSTVYKTVHDIDKNPRTLTAAEIGCMCQVIDGLGHTEAPDWQPGFATTMIWPNGSFKVDLATYVKGKLMWRDQQYK